MFWVLENSEGELAVVANMAGWQKLLALGLDARINRFAGAQIVAQLPVSVRQRGRAAALRAVAASVGAIYPVDSRQLAIVDDGGTVIAGPGDKTRLAKLTGTARRTVWRAYAEQAWLSGGGWGVHAGCDG